MFGSFVSGIFGRLCILAGVVVFLELMETHAFVGFVLGSGLFVFGSYQIYLARNTVRVKR